MFDKRKIKNNIVFLDNGVFDLLALAANQDNKKCAWEMLSTASKLFHPLDDDTFNTLYNCVAMYITWNFQTNEFTVHGLFERNIHKIRPDYTLISRKNKQKHMPDFWVNNGIDEIPVEIKQKEFDNKALEQLNRYMKAYNSKYGVAVGEISTVEIPENIDFISINELKSIEE